MMTTPHILSGAAIGLRPPALWMGGFLAFASHFALDHIPHLEPSAYYPSYTSLPLWIKALVFADVLISVAILWFLARRQEDRAARRRMLLGAFCATFPDLWDNMPYWSRYTQAVPLLGPGLHAVHLFYHRRLRPGDWLFGLLSQAIVILVALALLRSARPRQPDPILSSPPERL